MVRIRIYFVRLEQVCLYVVGSVDCWDVRGQLGVYLERESWVGWGWGGWSTGKDFFLSFLVNVKDSKDREIGIIERGINSMVGLFRFVRRCLFCSVRCWQYRVGGCRYLGFWCLFSFQQLVVVLRRYSSYGYMFYVALFSLEIDIQDICYLIFRNNFWFIFVSRQYFKDTLMTGIEVWWVFFVLRDFSLGKFRMFFIVIFRLFIDIQFVSFIDC